MKTRLVVGTVIVFTGSIAVFGLWNWANKSSKASYISDGSTAEQVKGTSSSVEDFSTNYFATKITSDFKIKTQTESRNNPIVGQYLLIGKNAYSSDQLAITIGTIKSTDINEISSLKFRKTYPNEYLQTTSDPKYPAGAVVFTKKTSYEKSVFWLHDGKYVSVVVSGGVDHRAELENGLLVVLTNWVWL